MMTARSEEKMKAVDAFRKEGLGILEACKKAGFKGTSYYYQLKAKSSSKKKRTYNKRKQKVIDLLTGTTSHIPTVVGELGRANLSPPLMLIVGPAFEIMKIIRSVSTNG